MTIKVSATYFKKVSSTYHTGESTYHIGESISISDGKGKAMPTTVCDEMQPSSSSMSCTQEPMSNDTVTLHTDLSISTDDSGITTIPLVTLDAICSKAIELLSTSNAITCAPGTQKKACMVLSYSQVTPHLIQAKSDGQYICDINCQQWVSSQLCSHTLAVAERNGDLLSFLQWYTTYAKNPNIISTLAMGDLPHGRGRKGEEQSVKEPGIVTHL